MGVGMSRVISGVYVGSIRDSRDEAQLTDNNITHVVSIHDGPKPQNHPTRKYLCISASDSSDEDVSVHFSVVNDFIHEARQNNGAVLIHCLAGVSRSVTLTTAYLMTVTGFGYRQCLNAIQQVRKNASPNFGFKALLRKFEVEGAEVERTRLMAKYANTLDDFANDRAECEALVNAFQRSLAL